MMKWIVLWVTMALVAVVFVARNVTPWPSVMIIRAIFDAGTEKVAAELEDHVPEDLTVREGIVYDPEDPDALLDIYSPAGPAGNRPTVVWVHGGGFVSGGRGAIANYLKVLAGRGFDVVSVGFTPAPEATYPTPVRQVTRALAYLDANASELGINRKAFVLAGDSAGSQIAAQIANLATAPDYAEAVGIASPVEAWQIRGALLFCGVYDMDLLGEEESSVVGWFLDAATWAYSGDRDWNTVPGFDYASVARHITPAFPSAFVSAGNADPLEPQSRALLTALKEKQVSVEELFFPEDHEPELGHEYQFDLASDAGRLALDRVVTWLNGLSAGW